MQIHWHRIIGLILFIFLVVMLVKYWPVILASLGTINHLSPRHTTDEKTAGLITLGLVCALLVALVKILTHHEK